MYQHSSEMIGRTLIRIRLIRRFPEGAPIAIGSILVSAIATLDWVTGTVVSLSLLYGLAVVAVTWLGSRRHGLLVAGLAASEGLLADVLGGNGLGAATAWNAVARLGVLVVMAWLVSALKDSLIEQRRRAMIDPLTGALNRRSFDLVADRERIRAGRNGSAVTLAYFDLDDFKDVNDRLGHTAGDRLLRVFAASVRAAVRGTDTLCRIGGDEFILMLPDTDAREAVIVVDRVRRILAECCRTEEVPVTVSVGVTTYRFPPATVEAMIGGADQLMYRAKSRGGDTVVGTVIVGQWNRWADHVADTEQALDRV
jgi:diguanylate cyclase (GGDEF)-like protein